MIFIWKVAEFQLKTAYFNFPISRVCSEAPQYDIPPWLEMFSGPNLTKPKQMADAELMLSALGII